MIVKKLFLPGGLVLAVLLAFFAPELGIGARKAVNQNLLIVVIFLVCGLQTSLKDLRIDPKSIFFLIGGGVAALILSPLFAWGIALAFGFAALPAAGLIVMAAAPPTLSSGIVMTETSGGNNVTAVAITMLYNLAAVFTIPFMLALCVASDSGIDSDPLNMLKKLLLLVVLPFAAGFGAKFLFRIRTPSFFSYISSVAVILLVLFFFSASSVKMKHIPAGLLIGGTAATFLIHFGSMALFWFGGKALRIAEGECKAYLFTAASKTITMALTTLAILGAETGDAVIPCLLFYFIQMLFDSFLAAKMGLSVKTSRCSVPGAPGTE